MSYWGYQAERTDGYRNDFSYLIIKLILFPMKSQIEKGGVELKWDGKFNFVC